MLRTSDLLRIVVRRQVRQLRFGVILSIGIGIAMFLGVDVVGKDIEQRVARDVALIGTVTVLIAEFDDWGHNKYPFQEFLPKTLEAVQKAPGVLHAGRLMRWPLTVDMLVGTRTLMLRAQGVDANFWDVYAIHPAEGRLFTEEDDKARSRVCVLGDELARRFFGSGPYVGRTLTIFSDNYMVIGVAGGVLTRAWRDRCFVPLNTALDRFADVVPIKANRIVLRTGQLEEIAPLLKMMPDILQETQGTPRDLVTYENARDELSNVRLIVSRVNLILQLGIFAALGLGGFGIWQSSFASVRERTQEIGLQLAMGAEQLDIVKQFLGESLFNALLGGLAGVLIGVSGVIVLCLMYELPVPWLRILVNIPLCLIVSALVGAVGGTWPAIQAGRMDVATALRFE